MKKNLNRAGVYVCLISVFSTPLYFSCYKPAATVEVAEVLTTDTIPQKYRVPDKVDTFRYELDGSHNLKKVPPVFDHNHFDGVMLDILINGLFDNGILRDTFTFYQPLSTAPRSYGSMTGIGQLKGRWEHFYLFADEWPVYYIAQINKDTSELEVIRIVLGEYLRAANGPR